MGIKSFFCFFSGQVLEIHTSCQAVKTFVVGPRGTIFPAEYPPFCVEGIKPDPTPIRAVSKVPTEITDSVVDSSLLLALASEQIHGSGYPSSNTDITGLRSHPQFTTSIEEVAYLSPSSFGEKRDPPSLKVRQEIVVESTSGAFITETEHCYQLPQSEQTKSFKDSEPQPGGNPIVKVEVDGFLPRENLNQIDLQNFVTVIEHSEPERISCVETTSPIQTTQVYTSETSQVI